MTEIKLLPCPFCGSTNVAQGASRGSISVWCFCGSQGPSVPFPDECIDPVVPILKCREAWNRRSTLSDAVAEREAEPVAWRWKPKGSEAWIYDPKHEWLEAQSRDEIDAEPLYLDPPPTSELEALRKRVAELETALEPFADIADLIDAETEGMSETDELELHFHDYLMASWPVAMFRIARRVREGGKADG